MHVVEQWRKIDNTRIFFCNSSLILCFLFVLLYAKQIRSLFIVRKTSQSDEYLEITSLTLFSKEISMSSSEPLKFDHKPA